MREHSNTKIMVALFMLAAGVAGFFVRDWTTQLSNEDLNPGRASNCETQIAQAVDVLDDESLPSFGVDEVNAFGTLSAGCLRPDVLRLIDPVKIALLEATRLRALEVVGADP